MLTSPKGSSGPKMPLALQILKNKSVFLKDILLHACNSGDVYSKRKARTQISRLASFSMNLECFHTLLNNALGFWRGHGRCRLRAFCTLIGQFKPPITRQQQTVFLCMSGRVHAKSPAHGKIADR